MSNQINPVPVRDVLLDLDDKINFAVFRSGQNISTQRYPANSQSSSQHVYAVQVPSTTTVVSRNVVWGSTITITVTGNVAQYERLVNFQALNLLADENTIRGADCLAPFPLNQLCTNMAVQINNTTLSLPVNQVLDPLLRAVDKTKFEQWNGTTPTQLDKYASYVQALPQVVSSADALAANAVQFPYLPTFNSPFNPYQQANCNNAITSRNSFVIDSITGNSFNEAAEPAVRTVAITFTVREPLFVSPFLFGENEGAGLSGITQINITCQMDALASRALRYVLSATTGSTKSVQSVSYADSYIECKYLTPKPSDLIPSTIITPLATYTNYQLPASSVAINEGGTGQLTSNSIMLNSYPDKVFVWVADSQQYLTNVHSDSYATITSVQITLNNQSGILSNFDITQLFRASVESGSKQTFDEYSGRQGDSATGISTCGSVLMLNFGDVINIAQDYYAPGSLATAQFQIIVNFTNNTAITMNPQLNTMMMYSGILSTSNGSSSAYTSGVLSKQAVLDAAASPAMNKIHLARYVGSGLHSCLKSIASSVLPISRKALSNVIGDENIQKGANVLGALGFGKKGLHSKLF